MRWDKETPDFFVGINYPWNNYGWDVGKNPYGKPKTPVGVPTKINLKTILSISKIVG